MDGRSCPGMHWKRERGGGGHPLPRRPIYAQPLSPWRQVPSSKAFVTDGGEVVAL